GKVLVTSTAADGHFVVDGAPPGSAAATVSASGYVARSVRWQPPAEARVALRRAARIAGVVRDEDGRPVARAQLSVLGLVDGAAGERVGTEIVVRRGLVAHGRVSDDAGPLGGAELWVEGALRGVTAADGGFELARLSGPILVEVRARGHAPGRFTVEPGATAE